MKQKTIEILKELQSTSGRIDKENILRNNKDNEEFKEILYFLLNPFIVTGISDKKLNKKVDTPKSPTLPKFIYLLDYIKDRNTGRDEDIGVVRGFLSLVPNYEIEYYKGIITKKLKLGLTAKTVNKIFGKGFIPEFNVMLAKKYSDYIDKLEGKSITVTTKLDGLRNLAIVENGKVSMFSRNGQPQTGFIEIENELKTLPNGVYDGEILKLSDDNVDSGELFRDTQKIARTKDNNKTGLGFYIFDMLGIDEFKNGKSETIYKDRFPILCKILHDGNFKFLKPVNILYIGKYNESIIQELLTEMIEENKEGLMINLNDGLYECKRTDKLLKVKEMHTVDLKIVGFEEGDGNLKGTLGRVNVDYKGVVVGVGSGFSLEDREYIWNSQDTLLGSIIEVQYFEESVNSKTGEKSLRFPVFKRFRDDKTEESYN